MSAYIGICLEDGAFLAADTRRTDVDTDTPWKQVIKKIYQLNPYTIIYCQQVYNTPQILDHL